MHTHGGERDTCDPLLIYPVQGVALRLAEGRLVRLGTLFQREQEKDHVAARELRGVRELCVIARARRGRRGPLLEEDLVDAIDPDGSVVPWQEQFIHPIAIHVRGDHVGHVERVCGTLCPLVL